MIKGSGVPITLNMGFFSYLCKECGHPLLSQEATSRGINEWMTDSVVLTNRGDRTIGPYDGYGRVGGEDDATEYGACLHVACWEKAGKPNFDHYGSPSEHARDQGFFFDDGVHDLIDPRITEGREELLTQGQAARTKAQYNQKAREVYDWTHSDLPTDSEFYQAPWQRRFSYGPRYTETKGVAGEWYISDSFRILFVDDPVRGTEGEIKVLLAQAWAEYEQGDEFKALIVRAEELREKDRRAFHEKLKAEGRYEVSYHQSRKVERGYTSTFTVRDRMTYDTVAEFDYTGPEDNSTSRQAQAQAEADRLNAQWASNGYPYEEVA